jgi:hypothetical protein
MPSTVICYMSQKTIPTLILECYEIGTKLFVDITNTT